MNHETAKRLAIAVGDGDSSAWEPFLDLMIELGYSKAVERHRRCFNGWASVEDGIRIPCDLVFEVSMGNFPNSEADFT